MTRKELTIAEKIALLDQIKACPSNFSYRQISEITGVPKSTIGRLIRQQEKLREEWSSKEKKQETVRKRMRRSKDPAVEDALNQWYSSVSERGLLVSAPMIRQKSQEIARKLGHHEFKATDGWLSRWKLRNGVKLEKARNIKNLAGFLNLGEDESYADALSLEEDQPTTSLSLMDVLREGVLARSASAAGNGEKMSEEILPKSGFMAEIKQEPLVDNESSKNLQKNMGGEESGKTAEVVPIERVTAEDAEKYLEGLQRYFLQQGNEDCPLLALQLCAYYVHSQSLNDKR